MASKLYYYDFMEYEHEFYLVAATVSGLAFVSSSENQFYEFYSFYPHKMTVQNADFMQPYIDELIDYLMGRRREFTFRLDFSDFGTPLQHEVLDLVLRIPYGTQMSSQSIALAMKEPASIREVENAVILNPILFVIPTHRVILTKRHKKSYRCGPEMKEFILNFEKRMLHS